MIKSKDIKVRMLLKMSHRKKKKRLIRELRSQINSPFYKNI